MKTTIRISEAANSETISVLPQPSALPRMIASTNRNSDEVNVTVPIQSIRLPCGSRDSSTFAIVSSTAAAPIGTLMKKIEDQPNASVRTPPSSGPTAAAEAIVAPQIPNAVPALAPVELLGDQRQPAGVHDRAADALARARDDQEQRARGQRAQERGQREQAEADREHELAAEQVGERAGGQQERGQGQRVGVDHPLDVREARVQIGRDLRQRDVHDRDVEQQHERRDADNQQRPPLTFHKQSILAGWAASVNVHVARVPPKPVG